MCAHLCQPLELPQLLGVRVCVCVCPLLTCVSRSSCRSCSSRSFSSRRAFFISFSRSRRRDLHVSEVQLLKHSDIRSRSQRRKVQVTAIRAQQWNAKVAVSSSSFRAGLSISKEALAMPPPPSHPAPHASLPPHLAAAMAEARLAASCSFLAFLSVASCCSSTAFALRSSDSFRSSCCTFCLSCCRDVTRLWSLQRIRREC